MPMLVMCIMSLLLLALVAAGQETLSGAGDKAITADVCITMGGSCVNRAGGVCHADARLGAGCPDNSVCCLPYGALCQWAGGRCDDLRSCGGNHIIDHGMPCDDSDSAMCCLPRSRANGYSSAMAAQKSLTVAEQTGQRDGDGKVDTNGASTLMDAMTHNMHGNQTWLTPSSSEIGLSVALPLVFLIVSVGFVYAIKGSAAKPSKRD